MQKYPILLLTTARPCFPYYNYNILIKYFEQNTTQGLILT